MKLINTRSNFGLISLALHWIVVLGIIGQWALAESDRVPLHQSIGVIILALAVVRLTWLALSPRPDWPADMRPYEITLARFVHAALYLLLFAIPISGWLLASVEDEPLRFFGWFDLPRFVVGSEDTLEEIHETLFNGLVALAVLHLLGAIKHWVAGKSRRAGPRAAPGDGMT